MPNIKSAKKRVLVNQKKNMENRSALSAVKTAVKKYNNAIDTNRIEEAEAMLPSTMSVIDSAVSKGVLHKNNAANYKSRLSKRLSDVKSGKIVINIKKDNKTIAAEKAKAAKDMREAVRVENAKKAQERAQVKSVQKAEAAKADKTEKVKKAKAEKAETTEKTEKAVKATKAAKGEKTDKAETVKTEKPKAEKKEKPKKAE